MMHSDAGLTFDDFLKFPEDGRRHELIGGVHVVTASPVPDHQRVVAALFRALDEHARATGAGEVFLSPLDVVLSLIDVVVPDLIFVRHTQSRMVGPARVAGAPALVIEVLSPGTRARDNTLKRELYERSGVEEFWLVDPDDGSVEVCRRTPSGRFDASRYQASTGDTITTPLLQGLTIRLTELFEGTAGGTN